MNWEGWTERYSVINEITKGKGRENLLSSSSITRQDVSDVRVNL
jgi:hypothetical protein